MKKLFFCSAALAMAGFVFSSGCAEPDSTGGTNTTANQPAGDDHDHDHGEDSHGHSHGHEGPRGGLVIELGHDHQFHAELVDDEAAGTVTIYMMDHDMKPLANPVTAVSLVVTDGTDSETFDLEASGTGESAGFSSNASGLLEMLEKPEIKGKLRATIDGTPYSGDFTHAAHDHDHEGQDHDADDHDADDHGHEAPGNDG